MEGLQFGVKKTPGILVNGKFYRGVRIWEELYDRIEEEFEEGTWESAEEAVHVAEAYLPSRNAIVHRPILCRSVATIYPEAEFSCGPANTEWGALES